MMVLCTSRCILKHDRHTIIISIVSYHRNILKCMSCFRMHKIIFILYHKILMFINFEHIKNREHGKYVVQVLFFLN